MFLHYASDVKAGHNYYFLLLNIKVKFLHDLLSSFPQCVTVVAGIKLARYYEVTSPSFAITSSRTCNRHIERNACCISAMVCVMILGETPRDWS